MLRRKVSSVPLHFRGIGRLALSKNTITNYPQSFPFAIYFSLGSNNFLSITRMKTCNNSLFIMSSNLSRYINHFLYQPRFSRISHVFNNETGVKLAFNESVCTWKYVYICIWKPFLTRMFFNPLGRVWSRRDWLETHTILR